MLKDIEWPKTLHIAGRQNVVIKGFSNFVYLICRNRYKSESGMTHDWIEMHELEIWCLDVIDKKWYKSEKKLPGYMTGDEYSAFGDVFKCFVSVGDGYIHYYNAHKYDIHDRISLYDLSPLDLQKKIEMRMRNKWKVYVFGFIKQEIESKYEINVPDYLKRIVLAYYTMFD